MQETQVRSLGQEDALAKEMAIHSSILAREIPSREEPIVHSVAKSQTQPKQLSKVKHSCKAASVGLYRRLLLLLLLSHFSRVRLCVTPETAAHQAPLSLGFSRQEHWSGLPFPSSMHESEK